MAGNLSTDTDDYTPPLLEAPLAPGISDLPAPSNTVDVDITTDGDVYEPNNMFSFIPPPERSAASSSQSNQPPNDLNSIVPVDLPYTEEFGPLQSSNTLPLVTISNNRTELYSFNIHVPANQNMLAVPTSLPASQAFYSVDHTSSLYTAPQTPGLNTQLELHSHRLNMIEAHMIQSSRISLLESKINQTQKPNFNLELPSIAAYHAQNRAVQDGGELCHCGLEPAV